jgi:hypothetical protein
MGTSSKAATQAIIKAKITCFKPPEYSRYFRYQQLIIERLKAAAGRTGCWQKTAPLQGQKRHLHKRVDNVIPYICIFFDYYSVEQQTLKGT